MNKNYNKYLRKDKKKKERKEGEGRKEGSFCFLCLLGKSSVESQDPKNRLFYGKAAQKLGGEKAREI